jgi:class 3 adenylate cyclase/tetratricopeptide (TPR) repeat protein
VLHGSKQGLEDDLNEEWGKMKCTNCQTGNDTEARFCKNCGRPLNSSCPQCQKQISPDAKFCPNCGYAIAARKPEIRPVDSLDGERRVVTILFCDLKGSTSLAEQLDPEEWAEIMNAAFKHLIEPITRYGGMVARLMGDAILAFFGAPMAHEDDPQRAVLAGLAILSNIQNFSQQARQKSGLEFEVRVGINTGLVVVGDIGSDRHREYTAMGDAVNLAARMEQTALPGTVQISEETCRLVKPLFEVEDLGEIQIKGKTLGARAYRVLKPKARPGSLRGLFGTSAPLVGREEQLQHLEDVIASVRQGRGQIVCLMGEAGIGKSRLIDELEHRWFSAGSDRSEKIGSEVFESDSHTWLESHSISYAAHLPYGPFHQLMRNLLNVAAEDSPSEIRHKIAQKFLAGEATEQQREQVNRTFEALLGVEVLSEQNKLEGEAFKRELFETMLAAWRDWTTDDPTVLVFDDLHWADQASIELLTYLFKLVEERPVLFLCAFRPERESPAWEIKQAAERIYHHQYTEIHLKPLTIDESNRLVDKLLTSIELPASLREMVMRKSDGNPFFVEQIVQSLIETGVIVQNLGEGEEKESWHVTSPIGEIAIPDNVQALLQARIDRLDDEARKTLHKAAVIGRSFNYRLLKEITPPDESLDRCLHSLEKVDLVRETSRYPERQYSFRHALAQETAYRTILRKHRRQYHLQAAEAIERLYPDKLEETASLLAHHFDEAGDRRALEYHTLAGDQAYRLYAISEAIAHYTRALETAKTSRKYDSLEYLFSRRGRAFEINAQFDRAMANYTEMEDLSRDLGDRKLSLAALLGQATVLSMPISSFDPDRARSVLDRALSLARDLEDRAAQAKILWILTLIETRAGDPHKAIDYGEQGIRLSKELNLKDLLAFTLTDLSEVYTYNGNLDKALESILEAQQIWKELDDKPMLANSLSSAIMSFTLNGEYDQAVASFEEAMQISSSINNLWGQAYCLAISPKLFYERGEMDQGIHRIEDSIRLSEQTGFMVPLSFSRVELGLVYANLGAKKYTVELIDTAKQHVHHLHSAMMPELDNYLTRIHLLNGNLNEAESTFNKLDEKDLDTLSRGFALHAKACLESYKKNYRGVVETAGELIKLTNTGLRYFLQYGYYYEGTALKELGRLEEARETLNSGRAEAERLNTRLVLWQTLASLGELERQLGNEDEAINLHRQAIELIHYIAGSAAKAKPSLGTGEELRTAFLAREEVKAALAFN